MPFQIPVPGHKPPVPEGFSSIISSFSNTDILNHFKEFEKPIPYMYRDSEGYPTIGAGHLLNRLEDALKLNLIARRDPNDILGRTATREEKEQAYKNLPPQPKSGGGYRADYYNPFGKNNLAPVFLPEGEIDYHLMNDIYTHADEVKRKFQGFSTFPPSAQKVLLDMEFNMGSNLNPQKWPNLYRAVEQRDWLRAGLESQRQEISPDRNKATRSLFNNAHKEDQE